MLKGYKYRIYPTSKQAELLNKHFGCCRLYADTLRVNWHLENLYDYWLTNISKD
jgi:transposase